MKSRIIIVIVGLIFVWWIATYWYNYMEWKEKKYNELLNEEYSPDELNWKEWINKANERLEVLKKKISLKWLITKADMYFENMEYTTALNQYLKVYKEVPTDREVNLKIWNIYYELNKYGDAYNYYKNIKTYQNLDKTKAVLSLINSNYNWTWSLENLNKEIDSLQLSKEENFYYKNSLICINDFSKCRLGFQEYFDKQKNTSQTWTWVSQNSAYIQNVENAFTNYYNFQIDDLTYKAALVTWAFYQNWSYFIALETSKTILSQNQNYKPILKIAAKSAYELWMYKDAKDFLIEYNKAESTDAEASYFLARVYEKLNEKLLSVIHYNKAIKVWYKDLNDIRRRLIFIYYELNNTEKMLSTFKELIDSKDKELNINDYNLAIYYHIINDDFETALKYSDIAKLKYKDSELFYGYNSWIMLQKENLTDFQLNVIENNIKKALEINKDSPMIIMVKWIFELKKQNYSEAEKTFKKAISLDRNNEYSETTKYFLGQIPKNTD